MVLLRINQTTVYALFQQQRGFIDAFCDGNFDKSTLDYAYDSLIGSRGSTEACNCTTIRLEGSSQKLAGTQTDLETPNFEIAEVTCS